MLKNHLTPILVGLDQAGSHLVYNTLTKLASLYDGDLAAGSPRLGVPVSTEDLLALFENGWISRYDSREHEHRYRITEAGRKAAGG